MDIQIQEVFNSTDLYEILGVPKDSDITLINKSYRKLALKYHPDRGGDSAKFQALSAVHCILSDEIKRKEYDDTGTFRGNESMADFDSWYSYFRGLFPTVTTADLDSFLTKYHGSVEEKADVVELYNRFDGDVLMMFNYVIGSDDDQGEIRICEIVDAAINNGEISCTSTYKKMKSKFLKGASKRINKTRAKALRSSSNADSLDDLQALIKRNQKSRLSNFEDRYGSLSAPPDINDKEFLTIQEKFIKKKTKPTK